MIARGPEPADTSGAPRAAGREPWGAALDRSVPDLAAAHVRFGRAVMWIYVGNAAVAAALLITTLLADLSHEKGSARERLSLETQVRAHYLARHLQLLASELTRLGLRSEIDLLDNNMEPERSLLRLSHEKSAFFNVGVAILGSDGTVMWSEPQSYLAVGTSMAEDKLFGALQHTHSIQIVPAPSKGHETSILYVASPILRGGQFAGALVGAIDLASGETLEGAGESGKTVVALATREGTVVYPPGKAGLLTDSWRELLARTDPLVAQRPLWGNEMVVAGAPVQGTGFILLSLADARIFFGPSQQRLVTRLVLGLALTAVPIVLFVFLLRHSLDAFRKSEQDALRGERLRSLGEAVDVIAHEVKNSLSGIKLGLDLILQGDRTGIESRHPRAIDGLRQEIERLSSFSTDLLGFSKGVVPRRVSLELYPFVCKVADLSRLAAAEHGIELSVVAPKDRILVHADPGLIHVIVANLVSNALDFAPQGKGETPRVTVRVETRGAEATVRVEDNGPGVPDALKARLFEPFATGRPSGVGLGLAFSRQIARAHGGDLVLLQADLGAAFRLTLPAWAP